MKLFKKLFAFSLATVTLAASVIYVTPMMKSLTTDHYGYNLETGQYEPTDNAAKKWDSSKGTYVEVNDTTSSTTSSTTTSTATTTETVLPASVTIEGKPVAMFQSADNTKTLLAAPVGVIPSGAKLEVLEAAATSQTFTVATEIMKIWRPSAQVVKVYDFNLYSKAATTIKTVDGKIAMSIPVPAGLTVPAGSVLKVYKFNDDGSIAVCEALIDNGRIVFGNGTFGTFAFVIEKAK